MRLSIATITLALHHHTTSAFTTTTTPRPHSIINTQTTLFASGGPLNISPIGIGSCAPTTALTNFDLETVHDTSDEWIRTRTGIEMRRVLVHEETLRSLGITAGRNAISMAGVNPEDIGLVICCTSSPDDLFGDAPSIAAAVGCTTNTVAFDLTAACSGFLFGIVTAGQFLENGAAKHALVIGADALTRWVDWDDRNSCILFGDGAGAMVLSANGNSDSEVGPGILGYAMHSNGKGYDDLKCIYRGEPKKITTPGEGTVVHDGSYDLMTMNGRKVYSFATREVPAVLEEAMEQAGITVDQVDHLLLHQANIRIMEVVAERLGMPMEKVITNLYKYGNTSAASIPLALDEAVRSGRVKKGDVIACAGFGAGLSWGAAILKWG
ncbi:3-oxoacyl-synthase [Thalassiosira pseudonana CCMP1335]|uniref:beta-ketoacyl-[acyl-carrier-protein] synthase III n=1 Tax=Thalassiosira pseudonana TaxID=35128 RepID=B8CGL6_THAPS|nr:3-oxoacyl-synthase [Thalassiosira pseudonana CCMP1335]EED87386.1 3-oxoacyl-synthase [Thalassiosira pseudonana CCMP1335]